MVKQVEIDYANYMYRNELDLGENYLPQNDQRKDAIIKARIQRERKSNRRERVLRKTGRY